MVADANTRSREPLKIVLVTSGIDHLTVKFHTLPEKPVAIVELAEWDLRQRCKYRIRQLLRLFHPHRYPDCELYCHRHNLAYFRVGRRNKTRIADVLLSLNANLAWTYRCPIIPVRLLECLSHGAINLHNSLLPEYRGGNPLFWQVLNGETTIGCTVHRLSDQIDGGDILDQRCFERPVDMHHKDLDYLANADIGYEMISAVVRAVANGEETAVRQSDSMVENKAPNCDWSRWRTLAAERKLSAAQMHDMACFVGEVCSPEVEPVRIHPAK